MSGGVSVKTRDERTITCTFPASASEIANALGGLEDGYALTAIGVIETGDQRDPVTKGVRLVFTKGERG